MTTLSRTVRTSTPPERVYPYLADFRNAAEWDSGTVSCVLADGDGGVGSRYRNTSRFAGRTVELDYVLQTRQPPTIVLLGSNSTTTARDTIVVTPDGQGSQVAYTAEFTFTGLARFLGPLMRPLLDRLGDDTAALLREKLDGLSAPTP